MNRERPIDARQLRDHVKRLSKRDVFEDPECAGADALNYVGDYFHESEPDLSKELYHLAWLIETM